MKKSILIFLGLFIMMQSCIPSLHPLYTPDTIAFEPYLLGQWQDGSDAYFFEKGKGNYYILRYTEENESVALKVHLVKLGTQYYLDFYNDQPAKGVASGVGVAAMIPTHTFAKVKWGNNKLEISHFAEGDWLEELFEKRRIRIKHEIIEDGVIVLTAGPKELQQFFLKYSDDPKAFTETVVWEKAI